jgi:hypothetical protein
MDDEFEILAAKILAREASPDEQSRWRELLSRAPQLREEFASLQATWKLIQEVGPAASALSAEAHPIPHKQLQSLQEVVRKTFTAPVPTVPIPKAPSSRSEEIPSSWFRLWQWWHRQARFVPVMTSALLLAGLGAALLFLLTSSNDSTESIAELPVAFALTGDTEAQLQRDGQRRPARAAVIHHRDILHLPAGARLTLLTSNGWGQLTGPVRLARQDWESRIAPAANDASFRMLRLALFSPLPEFLKQDLLTTTRGGGSIPLYSPLNATTERTPRILWSAEPNVTYDLQITDELNPQVPSWRVTAVASPADLAKLDLWKERPLLAEGLYRLRLTKTGQPLTASDYTFRVLSNGATTPARTDDEKVAKALNILVHAPACLGDALAELLTLSPESKQSELVSRLQLLILGKAGYVEEFGQRAAVLAPYP